MAAILILISGAFVIFRPTVLLSDIDLTEATAIVSVLALTLSIRLLLAYGANMLGLRSVLELTDRGITWRGTWRERKAEWSDIELIGPVGSATWIATSFAARPSTSEFKVTKKSGDVLSIWPVSRRPTAEELCAEFVGALTCMVGNRDPHP